MSTPNYYHIQKNVRPRGKSQLQKLAGGRKRQLVVGMVGVYSIIALAAGYLIFNGTQEDASASQSAFVATSIRFENEKEYSVGDEVQVAVTLQNTSLVESVQAPRIEMFSTRNGVRWNEAIDTSSIDRDNNPVSYTAENNVFALPALSSGERVEFFVTGTLMEGRDEFLTVLSKLQFENSEGAQVATTNRIFTKLDSRNQLDNSLVQLSTDNTQYARGEKANLSITLPGVADTEALPEISGKIYVSRKDLNSLVFNQNCTLNDFAACSVQTVGLEPGEYSAVFIDDTDTLYSNIAQFSVAGSQGGFTPSSQAQVSTPFGAQSINGIAAIHAARVVNANDQVAGQECVFEVVSGSNVVTTVNATVEQDRSCYTSINTAQLPSEGVYGIRLKGTDSVQKVAFTNKTSTPLTLNNTSGATTFGKGIEVKSVGIQDEDSDPLTSSVVLGVWHPRTGEYAEFGSINGLNLTVENGEFRASIPATSFAQGGLYQVVMKTGDGQISDFLGVSFSSDEIGFSGSGVQVQNYADLAVGRAPVFTVSGVRDTSGNIIASGDCGAEVYMVGSGADGVQLRGQIKNGVCTVAANSNSLTQSGPILVSFTGPNVANDIQQSRQFTLTAGDAVSYGEFNLEFAPARIGYANNAIIGPVTDAGGNMTSEYGLTLEVVEFTESQTSEGSIVAGLPLLQEKVVYSNDAVVVSDGYAVETLPSSIFESAQTQIRIKNRAGDVVLQQDIEATEDDSKLILPVYPQHQSSDKPINMGVVGFPSGATECTFSWKAGLEQVSTQNVAYDLDAEGCQLDWDLNENREVPRALTQVQIGDTTFSKVVSQNSGEAANQFVFTPSVRQNTKDEFEISFVSSPLVDRYRQPVQSGSMRVLVNGAVKDVAINNGQAQFTLPAEDINSQDIRNILDQRYLDVTIDAKATVAATNKFPDSSIFLGNFDVANSFTDFRVTSASGYLQENQSGVFEFDTDSCNAVVLSSYNQPVQAASHWQAGRCYVQVGGQQDDYRIVFEDNGFTMGEYDFIVGKEQIDVLWCNQQPCETQVIGFFTGSVEAVIIDQENEYIFGSNDIGNFVSISQNGLNPLKEYPVEIRFSDNEGHQITAVREILGEMLLAR